MNRRRAFVVLSLMLSIAGSVNAVEPAIGVRGEIGCRERPREVERLEITKPGVYENYLVDSRWAGGNRVKITADDVVVRHCEIRDASGNGIGVFGRNVVVENCRIHHLLSGTYAEQDDAHGITGRPQKLVVRNCDISYVSGDCLQFDPARDPWDDVLVENCTLWTGPLPADAAGFKQGERPGENAFDSKTPAAGLRSRITFRNCLFHGWNQPGQVNMLAALNLKENVEAAIKNCVFRDNQVCFRLRGPGKQGGALVRIADCAVYDSALGIRMEDKLENLKIERLGYGSGVVRKLQQTDGGPWPGYENSGEFAAPSLEEAVARGLKR
ncbi:MAG: right-handed parallel beta-helix repeat-containing protein [Pirellulales bacterium]